MNKPSHQTSHKKCISQSQMMVMRQEMGERERVRRQRGRGWRCEEREENWREKGPRPKLNYDREMMMYDGWYKSKSWVEYIITDSTRITREQSDISLLTPIRSPRVFEFPVAIGVESDQESAVVGSGGIERAVKDPAAIGDPLRGIDSDCKGSTL